MDNYEDLDIRQRRILEAVAPLSRNVPRKNLTTIDNSYATRETSLILMLIPEWANTFPPYNLCRLAAITKKSGYKTEIIDVNSIAWNQRKNWDIDYDPWHLGYFERWRKDAYYKWTHPHLKPLLDEYVDIIVEKNPTTIGFTIYDCNITPVKYFINELKQKAPHIITIGGGGLFNTTGYIGGKDKDNPTFGVFDYVASGEGETVILRILDAIENKDATNKKVFIQPLKERVDLDFLPMPNYNDIDFNSYEYPDMVAMELSRGCIAKCTFCDETHYWKYRDRIATRVLNEILNLWDQGIKKFWFIDSLVNGNIPEFQAILKGIIATGIPKQGFHWMGQGRVDKRMDLEYFQDIADSGGNLSLSFGVESGSNKVLEDMRKGITALEIEQNFTYAHEAGVNPGVMLIPGFPTERPQHFYETLTLLWRMRNLNMDYIGPGNYGCIISRDTALGMQPQKFGVSPAQVGNMWSTRDLMNTKVHRLIRLKMINILLLNFPNEYNNDYKFRDIKGYSLDFETPDDLKDIEYEEFKHENVFERSNIDFEDSLFSEHFPLCRLLWFSRGAFKLHIDYNAKEDQKEFGDLLGSNFNGYFKFEINKEGKYSTECKIDFIQDKLTAWRRNFPAKEVPKEKQSRAQQMALRVYDLNKTEIETMDDKWRLYHHHVKTNLSFNERRTASGIWSKQPNPPREGQLL